MAENNDKTSEMRARSYTSVEITVPHFEIEKVDEAIGYIQKIIALDYSIIKDSGDSGALVRNMQNLKDDLGKLYGYAELAMRRRMKELETTG